MHQKPHQNKTMLFHIYKSQNYTIHQKRYKQHCFHICKHHWCMYRWFHCKNQRSLSICIGCFRHHNKLQMLFRHSYHVFHIYISPRRKSHQGCYM